MPAFQFPDPAVEQTVINTLTGSTYQWKEDPGKWVITAKTRDVGTIIWEGDDEPNPNPGDYKLWYHTDKLELYFWYEDVNGVGAWVPTSAPITMLEDLDAAVAELKSDVVQINAATQTNENRIETFIAFSETAPPAYPDAIEPVFDTQGNPLLDENGEQVVTYTPDPANHKLWIRSSTNELHILRLQDIDLRTYEYELVSAGSEIWFGEDPPTEERFDLWFNTARLELLIKYADQWWPVSLPPDAVTVLLEDVEAALAIAQRAETSSLNNTNIIRKIDKDLTTASGQIATLEEEIEQLAPSLERGAWNYTSSPFPAAGQYTMIKEFLEEDEQEALCAQIQSECLAAAGNDAAARSQCNRDFDACRNAIDGSRYITTNKWNECDSIVFNSVDANGVTHSWAEIPPDHLIDIFNSDDDGFMVGDILIHSGGEFRTELISSRGVASGLATVKIFKISGAGVDLSNYVRKSGDKMTGTLETTDRILIRPGGQGASGASNMLVVNQKEAKSGSIARFQQDGKDVVKIEYNKTTSFENNRVTNVANPTKSKDAVNKNYLETTFIDQTIAGWHPSGEKYRFVAKFETPDGPIDTSAGEIFMDFGDDPGNANEWYYAVFLGKDADGNTPKWVNKNEDNIPDADQILKPDQFYRLYQPSTGAYVVFKQGWYYVPYENFVPITSMFEGLTQYDYYLSGGWESKGKFIEGQDVYLEVGTYEKTTAQTANFNRDHVLEGANGNPKYNTVGRNWGIYRYKNIPLIQYTGQSDKGLYLEGYTPDYKHPQGRRFRFDATEREIPEKGTFCFYSSGGDHYIRFSAEDFGGSKLFHTGGDKAVDMEFTNAYAVYRPVDGPNEGAIGMTSITSTDYKNDTSYLSLRRLRNSVQSGLAPVDGQVYAITCPLW